MAKLIEPLAPNVPIVDPATGNPTPYFARILREISDARVSESIIAALGGDPGADRMVVWDEAIDDLAFESIRSSLDQVSSTHGAVLYRDSTEWLALAPGTAGDVLTTNGSGADPSWTTPASSGGGLVLLESHTASSSAQLDFTAFIDAAYDSYIFEFLDIRPATDNTILQMRMSTDGGTSYVATAGSYASGSNIATSGFTSGIGGNSLTQIQLIASIDTTDSNNTVGGRAQMFTPSATKHTNVISHLTSIKNDNNYYVETVGGRFKSTTAVNAVRFFMSSGNISSGTIRAYGIPNT